MKRIIKFSRFFLPAVILSALLTAAGIAGYIFRGGFNLGVDFKAGLLQEIQLAPRAVAITYSREGNAVINFSQNGIRVIVTSTEAQNKSYYFDFASYNKIGLLISAMKKDLPDLSAEFYSSEDVSSSWLIESVQEAPQLGVKPYILHYLNPDSSPVEIRELRSALAPLGEASVQGLGNPSERKFMIRLENDSETTQADGKTAGVITALESKFGEGNVALKSSNYVGSRFSKQLQEQAGLLMALTLLLILLYSCIRFKPQFAVGAVLATAHDALMMMAFIAWTQMEFNTTTIAAILTILGYSINDTIVVFDRVRETSRLFHNDSFSSILNRSLTETFSRTIITTFTTMLAVMALFIFTTGSMKDFALALLVGMISGVYSTIFIASSWVYFYEKIKNSKTEKDRSVFVDVP
ncbi:MAG: protein translocase subunit SecF [Spirochaetaceae bacterium]|jgi:preprotein translocase subunit SecF|nr:protein translocase subunit SecF [Spirochaetaceae bacterium]